jgi:hypothetical protein
VQALGKTRWIRSDVPKRLLWGLHLGCCWLEKSSLGLGWTCGCWTERCRTCSPTLSCPTTTEIWLALGYTDNQPIPYFATTLEQIRASSRPDIVLDIIHSLFATTSPLSSDPSIPAQCPSSGSSSPDRATIAEDQPFSTPPTTASHRHRRPIARTGPEGANCRPGQGQTSKLLRNLACAAASRKRSKHPPNWVPSAELAVLCHHPTRETQITGSIKAWPRQTDPFCLHQPRQTPAGSIIKRAPSERHLLTFHVASRPIRSASNYDTDAWRTSRQW